ncbi:glutamate-5-semialdehyde dehydrogenase [Dethiobacter alkaliphilus]|uniref:glutamate-5-semialdehyde dehydrogenase n=1 Tax=Dethiobacter alkaliphilus TaxID=427926 RepID=UPI0022267855|nr:glutamate-5-semialdehyde dehydrogenase [Dethiobacter alkaliphilus]MCW3489585.1 glutamate-5-semialdehyde dehydrogenase [Dethiobacter alkaliphilus]
MSEVIKKAAESKEASVMLATASTKQKNDALLSMAEALQNNQEEILAANAIDLDNLTKKEGYNKAFYDRLKLTGDRVMGMVEGLRELVALPDPIGEVMGMQTRPNGLQVGRVRVPLGVVGIIYEARPNVTADASGLALKAGNAVLLRGSSEAIHSNKALVKVLRQAVAAVGLPAGTITLVEETDRSAVMEMMRLNAYLDVLIPRGGASLIKSVVENASVPVIETGTGNCHTFVDQSADLQMAEEIAFNAKTHRPGVCNAMETLLVHKDVAEDFLPGMVQRLTAAGVEVRGCEKTQRSADNVVAATEEDWYTEYLDMVLAIRVVDSLDEAILHINKYGSKHSEAIVTSQYHNARVFQSHVDAAAVYVNASTRYTDGGEFGLGAEMGISTQKLHARGPMGLTALTSTKFIINGDGQIR